MIKNDHSITHTDFFLESGTIYVILHIFDWCERPTPDLPGTGLPAKWETWFLSKPHGSPRWPVEVKRPWSDLRVLRVASETLEVVGVARASSTDCAARGLEGFRRLLEEVKHLKQLMRGRKDCDVLRGVEWRRIASSANPAEKYVCMLHFFV